MNEPTLPQVVSALAEGRPEDEQAVMNFLLQDVSTRPAGQGAANTSNSHPGGGRKATMRPEHNFPDERAERAYKTGRKAGKEAFLDKQPKPSYGDPWWLTGWQEAYDEGVELVSRQQANLA